MLKRHTLELITLDILVNELNILPETIHPIQIFCKIGLLGLS